MLLECNKAIYLSTACFASPSKAGVYQQSTVGSVQPAQAHLQPRVQRGDAEVYRSALYPVTLFTESPHQKLGVVVVCLVFFFNKSSLLAFKSLLEVKSPQGGKEKLCKLAHLGKEAAGRPTAPLRRRAQGSGAGTGGARSPPRPAPTRIRRRRSPPRRSSGSSRSCGCGCRRRRRPPPHGSSSRSAGRCRSRPAPSGPRC